MTRSVASATLRSTTEGGNTLFTWTPELWSELQRRRSRPRNQGWYPTTDDLQWLHAIGFYAAVTDLATTNRITKAKEAIAS